MLHRQGENWQASSLPCMADSGWRVLSQVHFVTTSDPDGCTASEIRSWPLTSVSSRGWDEADSECGIEDVVLACIVAVCFSSLEGESSAWLAVDRL